MSKFLKEYWPWIVGGLLLYSLSGYSAVATSSASSSAGNSGGDPTQADIG